MGIAHVINDIFMALFFLLVGLEIKYEMTVGELTNIRRALLPHHRGSGRRARTGYHLQCHQRRPSGHRGRVGRADGDGHRVRARHPWRFLGSRIPSGIRVFLSTLAVADDIIAILVIAIFYGHAPAFGWLLAAAGRARAARRAQPRARLRARPVPGGLASPLWLCVYLSGVHSTIAGVLLRVYHPVRLARQPPELRRLVREEDSPGKGRAQPRRPLVGQKEHIRNVRNLSAGVASRSSTGDAPLENALYPWVYFLILPLFALANADVNVSGDIASVFWQPCVSGRVLRPAFAGKPIGILLASAIVVKTGLCQAARARQLAAHGRRGGARRRRLHHGDLRRQPRVRLRGGAHVRQARDSARVCRGGRCRLFAILSIGRARGGSGVEYVEVAAGGDNMQHADREETRQAERMLDRMSERDCRAYRGPASTTAARARGHAFGWRRPLRAQRARPAQAVPSNCKIGDSPNLQPVSLFCNRR